MTEPMMPTADDPVEVRQLTIVGTERYVLTVARGHPSPFDAVLHAAGHLVATLDAGWVTVVGPYCDGDPFGENNVALDIYVEAVGEFPPRPSATCRQCDPLAPPTWSGEPRIGLCKRCQLAKAITCPICKVNPCYCDEEVE